MAPKVLVVDDDQQALELIQSMMTTAGGEVKTCSDPRRAADTVASNHFDVILVDAHMRHLDGFALTRAIRSSVLNHNTPVVMMTGFDNAQTLREGFRAGITFFLGKPFSQERFNRLFKVLTSDNWREKRRSRRLPLRTPVRWQAGEKRSTCTSVDLSRDGMLLENAAGLQLGDDVALAFNLPGMPSLFRMHARVTRKERGGNVVVRFLSPQPLQQEAITRYLSGTNKP